MEHKLAQKRSLPSKIFETVNLPGRALEKWSPEVADVMDKMRETDEKIREHADELRNVVRAAKSYTRTRDYMNAALAMAAFHERIRVIAHLLGEFIKGIDIKHYQFILEQFEEPYKDQLFQYDPNKLSEACDQYDMLIKEAEFYDWTKHKFLDISSFLGDIAQNLLTGKGHARRLMEKRFPSSFIKSLSKDTNAMISHTERMFHFLLTIFNELEAGISRRNITRYKKYAELFMRRAAEYHKQFMTYHSKNIVPLKQKATEIAEEQQAAQKTQPVATPPVSQEEKQIIPEDTTVSTNEPQEMSEKDLADALREQGIKPILSDQLPGETTFQYVDRLRKEYREKAEKEEVEEQARQEASAKKSKEELQEEQEKALQRLERKHEANQRFIDDLTKLAEINDPHIMAQAIISYAIILPDPQNAYDLIKVASDIIEVYGIDVKKKPEDLEAEPDPFKIRKEKPQELVPSSRIELPEGSIDQSFDEVSGLNSITPDKIIVSPASAEYVSNIFSQRLEELGQEINTPNFAQKLLPALKQAIFNGWVLSIVNAQDANHPKDKLINIYTRIKLNSLDPTLKGDAKIKLVCRFSFNRNHLMLKSVQKHFTIGE